VLPAACALHKRLPSSHTRHLNLGSKDGEGVEESRERAKGKGRTQPLTWPGCTSEGSTPRLLASASMSSKLRARMCTTINSM